MLSGLIDIVLLVMHDKRLLISILVAILAAGTIVMFAMPYLAGDNLSRRMNAVAIERSKIRTRERERAARGDGIALKRTPAAAIQNLVEGLDLKRWLGTEGARSKLMLAGYRNPSAMATFLFFRMVMPIALTVVSFLYIFLILQPEYHILMKLGICIVLGFIGLKVPELYLTNAMKKRQLSVRRAWPDALDLLLICVESGMSVEHAFRRVSGEIGTASIPLAEELTLTTAELSYLPDRRAAYENLGARTGLESVKSVTTALIQAERYGTPLGTALRVLAQENRDMRMMEAEKKAAALPPMLTVPMILFFLPVLFVVIMGPALMQVFKAT
jgi:tight adherence protein C